MGFKNVILTLSIIIVYALLLWYGLETFYPTPQYEQICNVSDMGQYYEPIPTKPLELYQNSPCNYSQELQNKSNECYGKNGRPIYKLDISGCAVDLKECNFCEKQFEDITQNHKQTVFFITLIIGIITLIIGYLFFNIESVGLALIGSGIWATFFGAAVNWNNSSNITRFLFLLVVFALILIITIKLNKKFNKKSQTESKKPEPNKELNQTQTD